MPSPNPSPPYSSDPTALQSVTEVAIISIPVSSTTKTVAGRTEQRSTPTPQLSNEITSLLARAKSTMEAAAGHDFAYFQLLGLAAASPATTRSNDKTNNNDNNDDGDDDGARAIRNVVSHDQRMSYVAEVLVLIVGGWQSIAVHTEDWLPSEQNQALVEDLGGMGVTVPWMWHLDVEREVVERVVGGGGLGRRKDDVLRVWRGVVADVEGKMAVESMLADLQYQVGEEKHAEVEKEVVWGWRLDKGYWADEKSDKREAVGGDAAEVVVFARVGGNNPSQQSAVEGVLKKLGKIVVHFDDQRAVPLEM